MMKTEPTTKEFVDVLAGIDQRMLAYLLFEQADVQSLKTGKSTVSILCDWLKYDDHRSTMSAVDKLKELESRHPNTEPGDEEWT
jgi:hypothetical protein